MKQAGCGVIPVYRDWRELEESKPGAVSNVKQAEKGEVGAGVASTLAKGMVPSGYRNPSGLAAKARRHRSEQLGERGLTEGCHTPYRTAPLYL